MIKGMDILQSRLKYFTIYLLTGANLVLDYCSYCKKFLCLETSLEWESFEQYCTWQLFAVHDISLEITLPLVQKLNSAQHAEALSMLLLAFKNTKYESNCNV